MKRGMQMRCCASRLYCASDLECPVENGTVGIHLVRELDRVAHIQHDEGAGEAVLEVPKVARTEATLAVLDVVDELEGVVDDRRDLNVDAYVVVFVTSILFVERMACPATAANTAHQVCACQLGESRLPRGKPADRDSACTGEQRGGSYVPRFV